MSSFSTKSKLGPLSSVWEKSQLVKIYRPPNSVEALNAAMVRAESDPWVFGTLKGSRWLHGSGRNPVWVDMEGADIIQIYDYRFLLVLVGELVSPARPPLFTPPTRETIRMIIALEKLAGFFCNSIDKPKGFLSHSNNDVSGLSLEKFNSLTKKEEALFKKAQRFDISENMKEVLAKRAHTMRETYKELEHRYQKWRNRYKEVENCLGYLEAQFGPLRALNTVDALLDDLELLGIEPSNTALKWWANFKSKKKLLSKKHPKRRPISQGTVQNKCLNRS